MTRAELNLLLYVETRCVDHAGRLDKAHMNAEDRQILEKWNDEKFIESGRICYDDGGGTWARMPEAAINLAHEERKARALRMWSGRTWMTTAEKNSQPTT